MSDFLHIPTLLITNAVSCLCICVSLVLIWRSARSETFILYWSAGYGFGTAAMLVVSMREHLPEVLALAAPGALLLACFGALWLGYRRFSGRTSRLDLLWASGGALMWLAVSLTSDAFADLTSRTLINGAIEVVYLLSIAGGLLRQYRMAPTTAIGLTIALTAIHIGKLALELFSALAITIGPAALAAQGTLFGGLGLIESSIFSVFLGLLQLVLIGQRSQQRFRIAAETDQLTGLANRRHFLDRSLPHLAGASDRGALVLFDIDHFKRVNDTYGHPVGDRALADFAATLATAAPAGSIAARLGGEEFALFVPDATLPEANDLANRIRRAIADLRISTPVGEMRMTVSCGVAGVSEAGSDYEALHCAADSALYAAKSDGRDRVAVHRRRAAAPLSGIVTAPPSKVRSSA